MSQQQNIKWSNIEFLKDILQVLSIDPLRLNREKENPNLKIKKKADTKTSQRECILLRSSAILNLKTKVEVKTTSNKILNRTSRRNNNHIILKEQ